MSNRSVLVLLLLLTGCAKHSGDLTDVLPVEVQRAWTLKQTNNIAVDQAPELVRSLGLRRALVAQYEGNGRIDVRVFEMNVETSAFELMQKWRQNDDLAAYKGSYFLVASADGPDRATLSAFLQALRDTIK